MDSGEEIGRLNIVLLKIVRTILKLFPDKNRSLLLFLFVLLLRSGGIQTLLLSLCSVITPGWLGLYRLQSWTTQGKLLIHCNNAPAL